VAWLLDEISCITLVFALKDFILLNHMTQIGKLFALADKLWKQSLLRSKRLLT
jgi:hypothetical protein